MLKETIIFLLIFSHFFFILAILTKKFSTMDIAWGLGFLGITLISLVYSEKSAKDIIILMLVLIWSLRLSIHLLIRSVGQPEDYRYQKYKNQWHPYENLHGYFKIFIFQSLLIFIISLPIIFIKKNDLLLVNYFGIILWLLGYTLEVYSDSYLKKFKKQNLNRGRICTTGPWRYIRYPQYLGEITLWFGIYFTCVSGWFDSVFIISPIVLTYLIVNVTGIPFLENKYSQRDDYLIYKNKTPKLIPKFKSLKV